MFVNRYFLTQRIRATSSGHHVTRLYHRSFYVSVDCVGVYCLFVVESCRQTSKMVRNVYGRNLVCGFNAVLSVV